MSCNNNDGEDANIKLRHKINRNKNIVLLLNCLGVSSAKAIELIFSKIPLINLYVMQIFILYNLDKDNGLYEKTITDGQYNQEEIKKIAIATLSEIISITKMFSAKAELYQKTMLIKENRKSKREMLNNILDSKKLIWDDTKKLIAESFLTEADLEIYIFYYSSAEYQKNAYGVARIYFITNEKVAEIIKKVNNIIYELTKEAGNSKISLPKRNYLIEKGKQLFSEYGNLSEKQISALIDLVSATRFEMLIDLYCFGEEQKTVIEMTLKYNMTQKALEKNIFIARSLVKTHTKIDLPRKRFKFSGDETIIQDETEINKPKKFDPERYMEKIKMLCLAYGIEDAFLIERARLRFCNPAVNIFLYFSGFKNVLTDEEILNVECSEKDHLASLHKVKRYMEILEAENKKSKAKVALVLTSEEQDTANRLIEEYGSTQIEKTLLIILIMKSLDGIDILAYDISRFLSITKEEAEQKIGLVLEEIKAATKRPDDSQPNKNMS